MEQQRPRRKKSSLNFQCIDDNLMSLPKYIPVLKRFINHIESQKLSDEDLQAEQKIKKLLMHAFSNYKTLPRDHHVKSVQALFRRTSFEDFKKHLYRYSELISTYLWVDRVQTIVTDVKEKNRILTGSPVNFSGYKLYCYLRGINYVPRKDLCKIRNVQLFKNILRCTDELGKKLETFIKENFLKDFNDDEKREITDCTKNFLEVRIKLKKCRRFVVSNPAFGTETNAANIKTTEQQPNEDNSRTLENMPVSDFEHGHEEYDLHLASNHAEEEQGNELDEEQDDNYEYESPPKVQRLLCSLGTDAQPFDLERNIMRISGLPSSRVRIGSETSVFQNPEAPVTPSPQEHLHPRVIVKNEDEEEDEELPSILFEDGPARPFNNEDMISDNQELINLRRNDAFEKLWKDQTLCDIDLIVVESGESRISAHKFILAAGSGFFSSMFRNDPGQADIKAVYIVKFSYEVVREMLRFMYCGKVRRLGAIVADLLSAADTYDVQLLTLLCKECLTKNLNDGNAITTYKLSKTYKFLELQAKAKAFVDEQMI